MNVLFQFLKLSVFIIVFFIFTDAKAEVKTELGEYEQLLQEAIKNKDFGKASYYSYELAKFYFEADLTDKAIEYLTQSLLYSKKAGDQTLTLLAYQKLGIVYTQNNNHSKALDHFQKALKIAKELKKPEFIYKSNEESAIQRTEC